MSEPVQNAVKIAVLGDFEPRYATHLALNESIRVCQTYLPFPVQCDWIGTADFSLKTLFSNEYAGLWIAPGSPYKDMENVIHTIRYARENGVPTLGNCGGFQHMLIELARNVCGIPLANHEETDPDAPDLIISKLSCSLVEQEEWLTLPIQESLLFGILKTQHLLGRYYCSYGLNPIYQSVLEKHGCLWTAFSEDGQVRAFELKDHPFFVGTLFQPALTSTSHAPNEVILAFMRECQSRYC